LLFRINPITSGKEKVLILGAGESGTAMHQLLQMAHSPMRLWVFWMTTLKNWGR
jgi:Glycerol-3-phosphate dehydrogenase